MCGYNYVKIQIFRTFARFSLSVNVCSAWRHLACVAYQIHASTFDSMCYNRGREWICLTLVQCDKPWYQTIHEVCPKSVNTALMYYVLICLCASELVHSYSKFTHILQGYLNVTAPNSNCDETQQGIINISLSKLNKTHSTNLVSLFRRIYCSPFGKVY